MVAVGEHLAEETKAKLSEAQKQRVARGEHWTQTPEGRKRMSAIAKKGASWTKTPAGRKHLAKIAKARRGAKGHWTQTPAGRKKMAKIATLGRRTLKKKIASGEVTLKRPHRVAMGGRARRQDISEATRQAIARRVASGQAYAIDLAREYKVSATTVRDWAKKYANAPRGPGGARRDIPLQTRELVAARMANGGNAVAIGREYGIDRGTVRKWAKQYGSSNGLHQSNRVRSTGMQACGACRTCLLCQKLGAEPQWIMCLVANPLEGGVV